ncbi:TetR/AcrR family transcriptional regulator [Amycolatopsis regifaucium]|uniref:TetR family transcriptional regulator n=1 Tax=Amycolatopsis regifaucium TaxID=546365 RepID=A0A154MNE3_9PSEU|nr:TetR/AcrR family transcriptional regulator [Amycolatopsis regifaucium]KZB85838.1 TetR family transcriptional regulator [Amycolatopsis regifaucium]OKA10464.1 TetR family transcriptional regulator [Amycolatopsis regifaucium]
MTDVADRSGDQTRRVDRFDQRRAQLAMSALVTLSELGYARTSLREIAQNSEFSHGVLHYYFRNKVELITYCVKQYKTECVARYDRIVETAQTAEELKLAFSTAMVATLREDARLHRLWYDLRNQSLFEKVFRADVLAIDETLEGMIWRIVARYAELLGKPLALTPSTTYALFDGLFQQGLLKYLAGREDAAKCLQESVEQVLARIFTT